MSDGTLRKVVTRDNSIYEGAALSEIDLYNLNIVEIVHRFTSDEPRNFINYSIEYCSESEVCETFGMYEYEVQNLDQTPPGYDVIYSLPELSKSEIDKNPDFYTNRDVTVRVMARDLAGHVTFESAGGAMHTFTSNGSHTFVFRDEAGNEVEETITMYRILKDATGEIEVVYHPDSWTNQPVTAAINFDGKGTGKKVKIEGTEKWVSSAEFIFEANGSRVVTYSDEAGNQESVTLQVNWIDLIPPTGVVTYHEDGSGNIVATLSMVDNSGLPPIVIDASGNELPGGETHIFTENDTHTFYFKDAAGNIGSVTASVTNIDHDPPEIDVTYSNEIWKDGNGDGTPERIQLPTNGAVRVIIEANEEVAFIDYEGPDIFEYVNSGYSNKHIFDVNQNGDVTFVFSDQAGNKQETIIHVTSIDRDAPAVNVQYSTESETKDNVIATVNADEEIRVLNNGGKTQFIFRENGKFTFMVSDLAGNLTEVESQVTWINHSKIEFKVEYSETSPTQDHVTATIMVKEGESWKRLEDELTGRDGSAIKSDYTFTKNGAKWIFAKDSLGNDYMVEMRVANIDLEPPKILYAGQLLIPIGGEVNPLEGLRAVDNFDGDVLDQVNVVSNTVNPAIEGEYQIVYQVRDKAGNTTSITRNATVAPNDRLTVYVNGERPENIDYIEGNHIYLSVFGAQGKRTIQWDYGKHPKGHFKEFGTVLKDILEVSRQGYYTFYVQDQERNYQLIHVYVIPRGGV
ncbi:MAG: DUF5011 domain-containing protein [Bacillaceae bacterium]|nr:DUF5011 domain-containing protein [Bacillaceae bacterium]